MVQAFDITFTEERNAHMISLLLATLCSAMLSIVMRHSEGRARSKVAMLGVNYLTCMILTGCFAGKLDPSAEGFGSMLGMGMINGVFYVSALLAMQYNIPRNGVVLPSVFSKTGALMVPLLLSIVLFAEIPSVYQTVGAVLAVAAILMMNYRKGSNAGSFVALFVLLLTEGMASSMSKIYQEVGNGALSDQFLLFTFTSAFLICVLLLIRSRECPGAKEVLYGVLIGVPNFVASRLVLLALETLPAVIVYPFRSVGSIVIVTLAGVFLFRERLTKRQIAAMIVIFAALALLNL